jgi:hypothetical protein
VYLTKATLKMVSKAEVVEVEVEVVLEAEDMG